MSFFSSMDQILAPITWNDFEKNVLGKTYCHVVRAFSDQKHLFSWEELNALLAMTSLWSDRTLKLVERGHVMPAHLYCRPGLNREGQEALIPDPQKVMALWRQGAGLVCNDVALLTSELSQVASTLSQAFGAPVLANLYATSRDIEAFHSHFDTHDVWAFQVSGQKRWSLYKNRAPHPVNHGVFNRMTQEEHDACKGPLAGQITTSPGDLLYLPRGLYHDACSLSDQSLHVTFSVTRPTGLEALSALFETLLHDQDVRLDIPLNPQERGAFVQMLTKKIEKTLEEPDFLQGCFYKPSPFAGEVYRLPQNVDPSYCLSQISFSLIQEGKNIWLANDQAQVPVPDAWVPLVSWVLENDTFSNSLFLKTFSKHSKQNLQHFLQDLVQMGVIVPKAF